MNTQNTRAARAKQLEQQILLTQAHQMYGGALLKHTLFKISNPSLAEDLVQDTFIRAWTYLKKGGQIDTMKAFLYRVLNNLIIDEYRKHKASSLEVLLESGIEPSTGDLTGRLYSMIDGQAAVKLIHRLPKKYRMVIRMRYNRDLSLTEMSKLTGQSKNALAVQLHRGLQKLKEIYSSEEKHMEEARLQAA